jgi:Plavaka transposase
MVVPVIGGSDKTTASVATGQQEYHPVYASIGNISNTARRSHGIGVLPVAFLPIPKGKWLCFQFISRAHPDAVSKSQWKKPAFKKFT